MRELPRTEIAAVHQMKILIGIRKIVRNTLVHEMDRPIAENLMKLMRVAFSYKFFKDHVTLRNLDWIKLRGLILIFLWFILTKVECS